jgi:hypothetical protein
MYIPVAGRGGGWENYQNTVSNYFPLDKNVAERVHKLYWNIVTACLLSQYYENIILLDLCSSIYCCSIAIWSLNELNSFQTMTWTQLIYTL